MNDSLGTFLKKRWGYSIGFALPIVLACVGLGILGNILDSRGVPRDTTDGVLIVGMVLVVVLAGIAMFARRPLPGLYGRWQKLWQSIPTWKERRRK